jgi:peptidoglycan/LPS O-acetylase OafA/YrhL
MTQPDSIGSPLFKYRPDIDGLRAVAVLAVLFFHADLGCPGGYVGVDVFFVISGYLITGLILKELESGRFKLAAFWERRIRRILPALALVIVSCLAVGWFLFLPVNYQELGESVVAQGLLSSNIHFWMKTGYFGQAAEVKPLLHTWSLAVEEQFYLLFPFVVIGVSYLSRRFLVPVILLLSSVSFGLSVYYAYWEPMLNFYLLPTRTWELLAGAFLSVIATQAPPVWLKTRLNWVGILALFCLLAIAFVVFLRIRNSRFAGLAAFLPCAGAALALWINAHSKSPRWVLRF